MNFLTITTLQHFEIRYICTSYEGAAWLLGLAFTFLISVIRHKLTLATDPTIHPVYRCQPHFQVPTHYTPYGIGTIRCPLCSDFSRVVSRGLSPSGDASPTVSCSVLLSSSTVVSSLPSDAASPGLRLRCSGGA